MMPRVKKMVKHAKNLGGNAARFLACLFDYFVDTRRSRVKTTLKVDFLYQNFHPKLSFLNNKKH